MASDTAPAVVPGPNEPAGTPTSNTSPQAESGLFGGLLAAVDPARPAFDLNPTTGEVDDSGTWDGVQPRNGSGASSSSFHPADADSDSSTSTKSGSGNRQERSVVRAWLLAGAERWKKGGDARLERLRVEKARHQANQVKETRSVAINRSGGTGTPTPRNGGAATGGKGLNSKSGGGAGSKGPKNSAGTTGNGSAGRSGGSGAGGGGGRSGTGGGGGRRPSDGGSKGGSDRRADSSGTTKTPKSPKDTGGSGTGGTSGKTGPSGSNGKDGSTGKSSGGTGGTGNAKGTPKTDNGAGPKKTGDAQKNPKNDTTPKNGSNTPAAPQKINLEKKDKKTGATGKDNTAAPSGTGQKNSTPAKPDTKTPPAPAGPTTPGATPTSGRTINTQPSREAGYRDGTRAATVTAHVQAYRDGVKDGVRDTKEAAEREKTRLDNAHAQRKQDRQQQPTKDKPVTTPASSADYHPPKPAVPPEPTSPPDQHQASPIQVKNADSTHIELGNGADRQYVTRGEVRSLAGFQRRLDGKNDVLTRIAERAKAYEAHAVAQTQKVTKLLEQAKGVKGGDKLVGALLKLEEAAKVQEGKAREVRKRAVRGAEGCKVVSANVETRYGDIYRAAVDSVDGPAELKYYQDLGMTNG